MHLSGPLQSRVIPDAPREKRQLILQNHHPMPPKASPRTDNKPASRQKRRISGVAREDSDDELGDEDLPWEWVYDVQEPDRKDDAPSEKKRRKVTSQVITGARLGSFECRVGDAVLLKADGSNEAWIGLICEFIDDDDGEKAANFMWFSTEKEIRNRDRKRKDFEPVYFPLPSIVVWRGKRRKLTRPE